MAETHPTAGLPAIDDVTRYARLVESLPDWRRIGEVLLDLGLVTATQVNQALAAQRAAQQADGPAPGLLDILLEQGVITPAQAKDALNHQIVRYYLPALGRALGEAEQTRDELADTYRRSLTSLATQSETIRQQDRAILDLRREAATLKNELRQLRASVGRARGR